MHIYVHVPFCARRCSYCDFAIAVRRTVPSEAYLDAVLKEWTLWQQEPVWDESPRVETVYLGGGTPSRIEPSVVARLLDRITTDRQLVDGAEITLEANPDDVTLASAGAWKAAGVNRVSLGVQSFHPAVLQWMHRTHGVDQVPAAVEALRGAGIEHLSLDLIFGLPAEPARVWQSDLERAIELEPEHLSLYGLTIEPHTPLGRWTSRGSAVPVDEETYATEFLLAHRVLTASGYDHYEVSNAGRPGHRAVHNSAYWARAPFVGLGPSAHSGLGNERRWNLREWVAYERAIAEGRSPLEGRELLDADAVRLEERYLGLRTREGLPDAEVPQRLTQRWVASGWALVHENRLRLTPEGWLRLDALVPSIDA
jgi:oxygen-independent coproporphyrinogen III oxidase